jgi:hypothetical protein
MEMQKECGEYYSPFSLSPQECAIRRPAAVLQDTQGEAEEKWAFIFDIDRLTTLWICLQKKSSHKSQCMILKLEV